MKIFLNSFEKNQLKFKELLKLKIQIKLLKATFAHQKFIIIFKQGMDTTQEQNLQIPPLSFDNISYWGNVIANQGNQIKGNYQLLENCSPGIQSVLIPSILKLSRKQSLRNTLKRRMKQKALKRVPQSNFVYIITLISTLLMGSENLYLFLWQVPDKDAFLFFPTLICRNIFFLINSYLLCKNFKVLAKIIFCFDRVFLTAIATGISIGIFSQAYIPFATHAWVYYSLYCLGPLVLITFAGYCRVILIFCQWNKLQTILMKISIAIGGASYFGLGMYYTIVDGQFTNGASTQIDETIKNLLFLYAFAGFDFHIQIFSMFDQTDGTNKFRLTYQLDMNPDDVECLLYGKKINPPKINKKELVSSANNRMSISIAQINSSPIS